MSAKTKSTKTKTKTTKAAAKKAGTAAVKQIANGPKTPARKELERVAAEVRKNPQAATVEQRTILVEAGLLAAGLRGKARTEFIETGNSPAKTAKAAAPAKPRKSSPRNGKVSVNDALKKALADGPATVEDIVPVVTKLRGTPTTRGVVVSGLRWGLAEERGWYAQGKGDTFRLTAAGKK